MKSPRLQQALFVTLLSSCILTSYAWDEYLNIYNNSNEPLNYSASPVKSSGITPNHAVVIPPYSKLNVKVKDGTLSFFERWQSKGVISLSSEHGGTVTVNYHGWANYHSLELKNKTKNSNANVQLFTDSRKMCDGPINCIIVSPNMDWVKQTLQLQNAMNRYEPLNNQQQVSTHNSYISSAYGKTYGIDPNQKIKISEQLEAGVTALEIDLHYAITRDDILLCHGHPRFGLPAPAIGCAPWDDKLSEGLQEISRWMEQKLKTNSNLFITLYLDASLAGHVKMADSIFQRELGQYIFSRQDLANYLQKQGLSPSSALPADRLTQQDILAVQKHILIVTKGREFENSRFVFDRTTSGIDFPYDRGVSAVDDATFGAHIFNKDVNHTSLWRLYEDQTAISDQDRYVNVFNIAKIMPWRVNWISMDKLTSNDSRLASLVWSWDIDFPLATSNNNAKPYAVLVKDRQRLQNGIDVATQPVSVLCHDETQAIKEGWVVTRATHLNTSDLVNSAEQMCQQNFGPSFRFAAPVNSYSMAPAVQAAANADRVLVNNIYEDGQWVVNQKRGLTLVK
ncbi:MAG: hypothetical protein A3F10_06595 [Coxiella sp. RIFCSPHIGHO2_12_FULL_42_15]|nr:MAG: hypothetical protein A3F10_06595 [Coxiella sp. RIFCSPHIGHO2_12_FULL_42_15]